MVDEVERRELCEWLLRGLPERDHAIAVLRYWRGWGMSEIGDAMGLTKQGVSWRIGKRILPRLRSACRTAGFG